MVFSDHNLVTDGIFGEMNLILCRNVLIYFQRRLKDRVLELLSNSLGPGGFLALGTRERVGEEARHLTIFTLNSRIYRKEIL